MPNGPQRNHSSTVSTGSERVEDPREPLGVEPAGEELDVLRLAGQHVIRWKRPGKRFLRSSSSSRNMTELVRRLPKSSVTRERGSSSRALVSRDSTGVMPEPAAMATWWRMRVRARVGHVKDPCGVMTSSDVAGRERVVEPVRTCGPRAPGRRPTRSRRPPVGRAATGRSSSDCRTSSPSIVGAEGQVLAAARRRSRRAAPSGTSKVTATESSVSRSTDATVSGWNGRDGGVGSGVGADVGHSDGLELVEGLEAGVAAAQRLAGGRAEAGELLGVGASRTAGSDDPAGQASARPARASPVDAAGRRDAELAQLLPPARRSSSRSSRPGDSRVRDVAA